MVGLRLKPTVSTSDAATEATQTQVGYAQPQSARMCAPNCAWRSSGFCANTTTRQTSRMPPRSCCYSRHRSWWWWRVVQGEL